MFYQRAAKLCVQGVRRRRGSWKWAAGPFAAFHGRPEPTSAHGRANRKRLSALAAALPSSRGPAVFSPDFLQTGHVLVDLT